MRLLELDPAFGEAFQVLCWPDADVRQVVAHVDGALDLALADFRHDQLVEVRVQITRLLDLARFDVLVVVAPAVALRLAVFDADETADERAVQRGHAGAAPNIVEMTPEVMILLGALPERVGSALNELRARLVKAVLTDAQLAALTGSNGRMRYAGCSTHLRHGRSIEGLMAVQLHFHLRAPAHRALRESSKLCLYL